MLDAGLSYISGPSFVPQIMQCKLKYNTEGPKGQQGVNELSDPFFALASTPLFPVQSMVTPSEE
jgi:hypothetical protein